MNLSSYNTTQTGESDGGGVISYGYKLASRLLGVPSRVIRRLRIYDSVLKFGQDGQTPSVTASHTSVPPHYTEIPHVPGPLGFIASRYFIGLFIMVILLIITYTVSYNILSMLGLYSQPCTKYSRPSEKSIDTAPSHAAFGWTTAKD